MFPKLKMILRKPWAIAWRQYFHNLASGIVWWQHWVFIKARWYVEVVGNKLKQFSIIVYLHLHTKDLISTNAFRFIYLYPLFLYLIFLSTLYCYRGHLNLHTGGWGWGSLGTQVSSLCQKLMHTWNGKPKWIIWEIDNIWELRKGFFRKENPKYGVLGTQCVFGQGGKKQSVTVCPAHSAVALVTFMVWANTNLNWLLSE